MNTITISDFKTLLKSGGQLPDGTRIRQDFAVSEKAIDAETYSIEFTASTDSVDRHGDRIAVDGWRTEDFLKNPVLMLNHDYSILPIGRVTSLHFTDGALKARAVLDGDDPLARKVFAKIEKGFLNSVSVGLIPRKYEFSKDKEREYGIDILESELIEISVVAIPANRDANIDRREFSIDSPTAVIDPPPDSTALSDSPSLIPQSRKRAQALCLRSISRTYGIEPMNIIGNLRAKRADATDALDVLLASAVDENSNPRDLNEAENADFETLKKTVEQLDRQIQRAEDVQAMKAASAVPQGQQIDHPPQFAPTFKTEEPKGAAFGRFVRCLAAGKGIGQFAAQIAYSQYHDEPMAKALAAGTAGDGGFLVPDQYSAELIGLLRPASVVRALGARILPMPNGNLLIPKIASGSSAAYIGENNNIGSTGPTFGQIQLTARKLAAICPISNDLIRYASPQADLVVRDDLIASIAQAEDAAFIRDDGTGNAPKGLRYWAGNTPTMTGTPDIAKITTDLAILETYLLSANVRMMTPGWIMAPRVANYLASLRNATTSAYAFPEMAGGMLRGKPFKMTTAVPVNLGGGTESEVYLADFAEVIIGDSNRVMVDVSSTAAYHNGSAVVSAFSLDQTVIRVILSNDLAVRHTGAVAVQTGCTWGA